MWSKYDVLLEAMALNPFGSTHFAWIDFGIHHIYHAYGTDDRELPEAFEITEDRVKILLSSYPPKNPDPRKRIAAVAGGYVTGEAS